MQISKCNVISGYVGFYLGFLLVQRQLSKRGCTRLHPGRLMWSGISASHWPQDSTSQFLHQCGAHRHTPQHIFTITLKVLRGSIMLLALRKLPVIGLSFVHIITSNMHGISILNVAIFCCWHFLYSKYLQNWRRPRFSMIGRWIGFPALR